MYEEFGDFGAQPIPVAKIFIHHSEQLSFLLHLKSEFSVKL